MSLIYASSTSGERTVVTEGWGSLFTVITEKRVYRVRARSEAAVRSAFLAVGLPVLSVDRDTEAVAS